MLQDIYDPLTEYINVFRGRFKEVAESTFANIASDANVDVVANKKTCQKLYANESRLSSIRSRRTWLILFCVLLWILLPVSLFTALYFADYYYYVYGDPFVNVSIVVIVAIIVLLIFTHKNLRRLKGVSTSIEKLVSELKEEAWRQMEPLNSLYDWDILARMICKTVPRLEFDPYFTTQRLADLRECYGWDDSFNANRSVVYSQSGLINGNPFIICRTRRMEMGTKTYQGSKTIYWTERERGSDGRSHTVQHSEVLTATVTVPHPYYNERTRLIYGNTAAPELKFHRIQNDLAGKERTLSYKWQRRKLRKKARKLENSNFAMMTNEDFEVAFDTSNRNDNQQYALLFTPLAQESMMKLLKDEEFGYGDDFDFDKNRMINTIISDHMQNLHLDMNPKRYSNFDFEKAKVDFYKINAEYFRAIYFSLAPLLCVPMYQQIRSHKDIYGIDMNKQSAFWEHEALANFWGDKHFKHPDCVTNCVLKTERREQVDGKTEIAVTAHGHRREQRVTYVNKYGGDGRNHSVPVYWYEYIPVTGNGTFYILEDNEIESQDISQRERIDRIDDFLKKTNLNLYRRHIASGI